MALWRNGLRTSRSCLRHPALLLCWSLALFVWLCPLGLDVRLHAVTTDAAVLYNRAPPPESWLRHTKGTRTPLELEVVFEDEKAAQKAAEFLDNLDLEGHTCRVRQRRPSDQELPFGRPEDSCKVLISGIRRSIAFERPEKVEEFLRQAGSDDFVWRWRLDGAFAEVVFSESEDAFEAMESMDGEEYEGRILRCTMDCSSNTRLTRVLVHGIATAVVDEDIQNIFHPFGEMRWCRVHQGAQLRVVYKTPAEAHRAVMTLRGSQIFGTDWSLFVCFPYYSDKSMSEIRAGGVESGIPMRTLKRHFERCGQIETIEWVVDTPPEFLEQALL